MKDNKGKNWTERLHKTPVKTKTESSVQNRWVRNKILRIALEGKLINFTERL